MSEIYKLPHKLYGCWGVGLGQLILRAASSLVWGPSKNGSGPALWDGAIKPRQAQRDTLGDYSDKGHLSRILKDE